MSRTRWLLSLLEKGQGSWAVMKWLAKEDEEDGNPKRAKGWRWLAENQRWPGGSRLYFDTGPPYRWYELSEGDHNSSYLLPGEVLDFITLKASKSIAKLLSRRTKVLSQYCYLASQKCPDNTPA